MNNDSNITLKTCILIFYIVRIGYKNCKYFCLYTVCMYVCMYIYIYMYVCLLKLFGSLRWDGALDFFIGLRGGVWG